LTYTTGTVFSSSCFCCSSCCRLLHPFPTRRSSDLEDRVHGGEVSGLMVGVPLGGELVDPPGQGAAVGYERAVYGVDCGCCGFRRSEEHTSELQSRENLVCRLLLEKKNEQINNIVLK